MNKKRAEHATFTIERHFDFAPVKVYAAWSTREGKASWFSGPPGWKEEIREFDFRVSGRERLRGVWDGGRTSDFHCHYFDIVKEQRIIYGYDMYVDDKKISISLATVEFHADGKGTKLTLTEQGTFLDGYDDAGSRERGTNFLMDGLEAALKQG